MTEQSLPEPAMLARFTIREFEAMIDAGVFANHPRVELHEGVLVEMNSEYLPHARCKFELARKIADTLDTLGLRDIEVLSDVSVMLSDASSTTPDISVWRRDESNRLLPADRALLLVEVSATTLAIDLGYKAGRYADSRVAEYWVIDLAAGEVVRHTGLRDGAYSSVERLPMGRTLDVGTVPGLKVALPAY